MGLLTKREEHINRIDAAPYALNSIFTRIKATHKNYNLEQLLNELQYAQKIVADVRSALVYLKNTTEV